MTERNVAEPTEPSDQTCPFLTLNYIYVGIYYIILNYICVGIQIEGLSWTQIELQFIGYVYIYIYMDNESY